MKVNINNHPSALANSRLNKCYVMDVTGTKCKYLCKKIDLNDLNRVNFRNKNNNYLRFHDFGTFFNM